MLPQLLDLDIKLFHAANELPHNAVLDTAAAAIHYLTYRGPIYYAGGLYLFFRGDAPHRRLVVLGAITAPITSFIANIILKPTIQRLRPFQVLDEAILVTTAPPNYSFPSGQTAVAFAVATLFFLKRMPRWERIAAAAFALLVAWDRMYTGHHYPSDVLGGAVLGTLVSWLTVRVLHVDPRVPKPEVRP